MAGCGDLMLLKCTSTYPASPRDTNILTIPDMRARFNCEVGLSDHTMGIGTAVAAVAHGACMIEKHFTLRRADGGVDSAFSLEPAELALLVEETERAWQSLGAVSYGPTAAEQKSLAFRRSLYVAEDMAAGDELTPRNLRIVRPAGGLHPRFYEQVLGRRVARAVPKGTAVDWSLLQ
jgi:N-acetylneuraminate synthase